MYDEESFEEVSDTVASYLEDIGSGDVNLYEFGEATDAESDAETEDDTKRKRILHVSEPVGPDYTVIATEGSRSFRLQSTYSVWDDIAEQLPEETIDEYVSDTVGESHPVRDVIPVFDDAEEPTQRRLAAAVEILDSLPDDDRRDLIVQLTSVFTGSGLKHSVGAVREGSGITGFTVFHRVFPYEDQFRIAELNETVERVRMAAHMGELLLKYTFNLPVDIAGTAAGDISDPGGLPEPHTRVSERKTSYSDTAHEN